MSRLLVTESASGPDQIWLFIARDNPDAADHFLSSLLNRCQSANQPLLVNSDQKSVLMCVVSASGIRRFLPAAR